MIELLKSSIWYKTEPHRIIYSGIYIENNFPNIPLKRQKT
jgi:hypothetical protein